MSKKSTCIFLNLMIPGLGQFAAKRRIIGVAQALSAVICVCWAVFSVFRPVIVSINNLLEDKPDPIVQIGPSYFVGILVPIAVLILVYTWSILDIMLFHKEDGGSKPPSQPPS